MREIRHTHKNNAEECLNENHENMQDIWLLLSQTNRWTEYLLPCRLPDYDDMLQLSGIVN